MPSAVSTVSVTLPATVAVETVPSASGLLGVSVARVPVASSVTIAGTFAAAPAARRVKVVVVIVAAFTALLNVAVKIGRAACRVGVGGGGLAIDVVATVESCISNQ